MIIVEHWDVQPCFFMPLAFVARLLLHSEIPLDACLLRAPPSVNTYQLHFRAQHSRTTGVTWQRDFTVFTESSRGGGKKSIMCNIAIFCGTILFWFTDTKYRFFLKKTEILNKCCKYKLNFLGKKIIEIN